MKEPKSLVEMTDRELVRSLEIAMWSFDNSAPEAVTKIFTTLEDRWYPEDFADFFEYISEVRSGKEKEHIHLWKVGM